MFTRIALWIKNKIDWAVKFTIRLGIQFIGLIVIQLILTVVSWLETNLEEFEAYLLDKIAELKGN